MNFSLIDAGGLALSVLSYGPLLLLPGLALTALSNSCGFATARAGEKVVLGVVVGLALLPLLDSLAARVAGLDAALALNLTLCRAGAGSGPARRMAPAPVRRHGRPARPVVRPGRARDGRFRCGRQALSALRRRGHGQACRDRSGDRRQRHTTPGPFLPAARNRSAIIISSTRWRRLSQRIAGGLVDARAAVGGLAFWVGIGLYGLVDLLLRQAGSSPETGRRRRRSGSTLAAARPARDRRPRSAFRDLARAARRNLAAGPPGLERAGRELVRVSHLGAPPHHGLDRAFRRLRRGRGGAGCSRAGTSRHGPRRRRVFRQRSRSVDLGHSGRRGHGRDVVRDPAGRTAMARARGRRRGRSGRRAAGCATDPRPAGGAIGRPAGGPDDPRVHAHRRDRHAGCMAPGPARDLFAVQLHDRVRGPGRGNGPVLVRPQTVRRTLERTPAGPGDRGHRRARSRHVPPVAALQQRPGVARGAAAVAGGTGMDHRGPGKAAG